jgi:hypothetical protein
MSFFASLKALVIPVNNVQTILSDDDEYLSAPQGSIFYECVPIPDGPGVAQIKGILEALPPLSLKFGPWIAGGAPRRLLQGLSLEDGDVDLFFKDKKSWETFTAALEGYELVIETKRAKTFLVNGFKVQMINRKFYDCLETVFKDFDFSVCQVATDGQFIACTKQAHIDVMDGLLRFAPQGTIAKRTLIQRMTKYVGHGFVPEPGLFELIVKSGLDYVSAYDIFDRNDVSVYDINDGEMIEDEESIATDQMNEGVMRTIARRLGLEKQNV